MLRGLLVWAAWPYLRLRPPDLATQWWCVVTANRQQWPRLRIWWCACQLIGCVAAAAARDDRQEVRWCGTFVPRFWSGVVLGFFLAKTLATATPLLRVSCFTLLSFVGESPNHLESVTVASPTSLLSEGIATEVCLGYTVIFSGCFRLLGQVCVWR